MKHIAKLLFEAAMLKRIKRTGYQYLGTGKESVAEHTFTTLFIAWVMARLAPEADELRLISMCLVHDLPEARMGDLNYVQKQYVNGDEQKAVRDLTRDIPFGEDIGSLLSEFNDKTTIEAKLANDADQLSMVIYLKTLLDTGFKPAGKWIDNVGARLVTGTGKSLYKSILNAEWDEWWLNIFLDTNHHKQ